MSLLAIDQLEVRYGPIYGTHSVSLTLDAGETVAIVELGVALAAAGGSARGMTRERLAALRRATFVPDSPGGAVVSRTAAKASRGGEGGGGDASPSPRYFYFFFFGLSVFRPC